MNTFPYPILEYTGEEVLARWAELREEGKRDGFYPVIIGDSHDAANLAKSLVLNDTPPNLTIEAASQISIGDFFKGRESGEAEIIESLDIGEWPETVDKQKIVAHLEIGSGRPKSKVLITKVPTVHSYEVLAYLGFGGWNECPSPEEHVAVHKYWHEKYGSEIISITGDVVECIVAKSPVGREESMALAREQFLYCMDIVFQGVETLSALAAGIESHDTWYFWWD